MFNLKLIKKVIFIFILIFIPSNLAFTQKKTIDKQFMEMVAKKTFQYFWNEANPENSLIPDATGNPNCSISSTGFGLAAICIAHQQGWITYKEAYERALKTLRNFAEYPGNPSKIQVEKEHGHHYHWVYIDSGEWIGSEGIFASDTAAFIAGVLTVGQYFKGTEVEKVANQIYENVDWTWFLNKKNNLFYVGWTPDDGLIWEYKMTKMGTLPLILAISSPTHPIPVETWFAHGNNYYYATYKEYNYVGDGAAYMHQWPLCFIDPRLKKDYYLYYFQDAREFSLASRQWCIDNKQEGYHENSWGLNPCIGPDKYGEYASPVIPGAPLPYNGKDNDGTVAPTAAISFMPFTPKKSFSYMKYIYKKYKKKIFGKYGFTDSYNIKEDFWAEDYLGIDQGPIVIMLGNYLWGTVWKNFMKNKYIKNGIKKIGFVGIIDNFDESKHSQAYAKWVARDNDDRYKFSKNKIKVKEGNYSLKIKLNKIKEKDFFIIEPELKNFSDYKYFAFWKSGGYRPKIILEDEKGKKKSLEFIKKVKDGSWELCYYNISKLNINKQAIKKILIYLRGKQYKESIYFDFIHLSHKMIDKLPPAPINFKAKTGEINGEILLSWDTPKPNKGEGNLASYKIRMSNSPIKNKQDFEKADDALGKFSPFIKYNQQKYILRKLKPGRKYYFAMAVENNIYSLSDLKTASAKANSDKIPLFSLNKKELVNFKLTDYKPVSSKGEEVKLSKVKAQEGDALKINYNFITDKSWHWVGANKTIKGKLPDKFKFTIWVKSSGEETDFEFKIIDRSGCVYGKKIDDLSFDNTWEKVEVTSSELTYWWGGNGKQELSMVDAIKFAFSTAYKGKGSVVLNKLTFKKK